MTDALMEAVHTAPVNTGEDDVRQFLHDIRQYPVLDPVSERELARRCGEGDADAIRQLVNSNLRLVVSIAREYAGRGVPLLDLIQEGSIGLLVAAKKFDYTMDFRFSTYATKWIRQGVTRCLLNHGGLIRIPVHTAERIRAVRRVQATLLQESGEEPTAEQIAVCLDMTADRVNSLLSLSPEVCSLDSPAGEEDGTLGILLEDLHAPQPQEELVRRELEKIIQHLMDALNDRQRMILRLHYGLDNGTCRSLEEISKELGISKERVRQIEKQAMNKLKQDGTSLGLEEFLE